MWYNKVIDIHWRAVSGSKRERLVLECAKEYGCDPNTHLFDRLLEDRYSLFEQRKLKVIKINLFVQILLFLKIIIMILVLFGLALNISL